MPCPIEVEYNRHFDLLLARATRSPIEAVMATLLVEQEVLTLKIELSLAQFQLAWQVRNAPKPVVEPIVAVAAANVQEKELLLTNTGAIIVEASPSAPVARVIQRRKSNKLRAVYAKNDKTKIELSYSGEAISAVDLFEDAGIKRPVRKCAQRESKNGDYLCCLRVEKKKVLKK